MCIRDRIASFPKLLAVLGALLVVISLWSVIDMLRNGPAFVTAFFQRQLALLTTEDAGHGGFFGYHFVVLLIGCFPASLFATQEMLKPTRTEEQANDHRRWMAILFWVVLILFSLVKTKIVHYSSLCYFPLTYLAALQLERLWNDRAKAAMWMRIGIGVVGHLFVLAAIALPWLGMHPEKLKPLLNDAFAQANLDAPVHWTGIEAFAGIWLLVLLAVSHFHFRSARYRKGIIALFGGSLLFVVHILYYDVRKIERYTQGAAVDFWQAHANERCYVTTVDYKSYAPLFYARTPPHTDQRASDQGWLLHGDIDRPVYIACKITDATEVRAMPGLVELDARNGFAFFRRDP